MAKVATVKQSYFGEEDGVGKSHSVQFVQLEFHLKLVAFLFEHESHFRVAKHATTTRGSFFFFFWPSGDATRAGGRGKGGGPSGLELELV